MFRHTRRLALPLLASSLTLLAACSSDDDPQRDASSTGTPTGTGASGGEGAAPNTGGGGAGGDGGGAGGLGGAGGDGGSNAGGGGGGGEGGGQDNQADHDALAACGTPTCNVLFAQRIEGGDPFTINHWPCTLEAMRDRTAGAYDVTLDHNWFNGTTSRKIRIFVTGSGEVEVGETLQEELNGVFEPVVLAPTQRCNLKDVAFFEQCLGYLQSGDPGGGPDAYSDEAYGCVFPSINESVPWFVDCQPLAPTCE